MRLEEFMNALSRRIVLAAMAGISLMALTPAMAQDQVTLRVVWWGSDSRTNATLEAIKLFEAANPNIKVQSEALPFDGYVEKLSTQFAANDAPDLIQLPNEYVAQFANGGALLNLDKVDATKLDPGTTQAANIDGQQVGFATGLASGVVIANKTLFDAAGVALPDDKTWTWDDFVAISNEISEKSGDGIYGSQPLGMDGFTFANYVRQRGHDLYAPDGTVTAQPEDIAAYFEMAKAIWDGGGSAGPEVGSEWMGLPPEQSGSATNVAAMGFWASAQFTAVARASGQDMVPLRQPSQAGAAGQPMMSIGSSQYWVASSRTRHPDETQALLNFLLNDVDAGKQLLLVRGTPSNSDVRDAITPELAEGDATAVQYLSDLQADAVPTFLPPQGSGIMQETFRRFIAEYLFGRLSAEDAANQMIAELKIGAGQ